MIVRGPLPLVDAHTIRFLQDLAKQYGPVRVAPDRALLSPVVGLDDLRHVLGQLSCVEGVMDPDEVPAGAATVSFPDDALYRLAASLARPAPLDEPLPPGHNLDELEIERPLVLLTGCFDLIHAGHVRLIEAACAYGAKPVVAMLTSRGIAAQPKNQGDRPLWNMADRVSVLRALRLPIRKLLFDGPNSRELIQALRPDYWLKEEKDRPRPIVQEEAGLVQSFGGRVVWVASIVTRSSTGIARMISGSSSAQVAG